MTTTNTQGAADIEKLMYQAQVFASSWSLVGGQFDDGTMMETAEAEKLILRKMLGRNIAAAYEQLDEATHLRELAAYRLTVQNLEREIAAQQPAPSPAPEQDEHEAFEAWAKSDTANVSFERDDIGYVDMTVALLWHAWQARASAYSGLPFGIIDPDYATAYTKARIVAWQYGYAIALQGSFTRDLDLVAVPWTDAACDMETLVKAIEYRTGLKRQGPPSDKPHGRKAVSLLFPGFEDPRWVDLSVLQRAPADSVLEDAARLDWLDQQCEGYGFQDIHEGNRWEISGPYANVRQAIDYERAARKQGATQ